MLHAVAELSGNVLGNVDGILRHEVDAHALRTDEAHHLLHFVLKRLGRIVEQQVGLVEEEHQPGFSGSPTSGSTSNSSDNSHSRKVA